MTRYIFDNGLRYADFKEVYYFFRNKDLPLDAFKKYSKDYCITEDTAGEVTTLRFRCRFRMDFDKVVQVLEIINDEDDFENVSYIADYTNKVVQMDANGVDHTLLMKSAIRRMCDIYAS